MKTDYFKAAKQAAKRAIKETGDISRAHRVAIEIVSAALPGKPAELHGNMAWQAVMAAR